MDIERNNADFFAANSLNIMDFVSIKGKGLISVHIIDNSLPDNIIYEIETMFWK